MMRVTPTRNVRRAIMNWTNHAHSAKLRSCENGSYIAIRTVRGWKLVDKRSGEEFGPYSLLKQAKRAAEAAEEVRVWDPRV